MSEDLPDDDDSEQRSARDRLGEEKDRAVAGFDQRVVDILSWVLDTETRARIFVYLRQHPWSTSEEVADGTGLYPSTVREALAELADEAIVERRKRESEGAGNNPYEYTAIAPSELVGGVVGRVQNELNTVFNLDAHLGRSGDDSEAESGPVHIEVEDGTTAEAEVGDAKAAVDNDMEVEADVDEDGASVEGEVDADVQAGDAEAGVDAEGEVETDENDSAEGEADDEDEAGTNTGDESGADAEGEDETRSGDGS